MFGLDWSELALIAAVALVVIGPKDLPRVLKTAGQWAARARSMARDFQRSLEEIAQEADLGDVQAGAQRLLNFDLKGEVKRHLDPDGTIAKSLEPPPELLEPLFPPSASGATPAADGTGGESEPVLAVSPEAAERQAAILMAQGLAALGPEPELPEHLPLSDLSLEALGLAAPDFPPETPAPEAEASLPGPVAESEPAPQLQVPAPEPALLPEPALADEPARMEPHPERVAPERVAGA